MDIAEIYEQYGSVRSQKATNADLVESHEEFPTVPTGSYRVELTKKEWRPAGDKSPWPGRLMATGRWVVYGPTGQKLATSLWDLSPEKRVDDNGRLDTQYRLWLQAATALDMAKSTPADIFEMLESIPYQAKINLLFKTSAGWRTAGNDSDAASYREAGYTGKTFLNKLEAVK